MKTAQSLANAYRDPIFVSLHVSTTGATGNTRAYFYQFPVPFQATDASLTSNVSDPVVLGTAIPWEQAQRPFSEQSRRLANLVQIELNAPLFAVAGRADPRRRAQSAFCRCALSSG